MKTSVVVPWRPGKCRHRLAAWEHSKAQWDGLQVTAADDGGQPFSRAASINLAAEQAPADVYVIADADILIDRAQVELAVELADWSLGLVVAFDRYAYVSQWGTEQILQGRSAPCDALLDFTLPNTVSSCVAVSHATWAAVGGFPSQFRGWGYEDVAFEVACATLTESTRRIPGTVWHLYHPPARERPQVNAGRLDELVAVRHDPDRFRERMAVAW